MKKSFLVLAAMVLFLSAAGTAVAQNAAQEQSYVTNSMAKKIANHCRNNGRAEALFMESNNITFIPDARQILAVLDKHLDYAENFLSILYEGYGMRLGREGLEAMGFTMQETERVVTVWAKEEDRKKALAEQQKKEEEQLLLEHLNTNSIFIPEQLHAQPQVIMDPYYLSVLCDTYYDSDKLINYTYHCILSKEGKLSLIHPGDTANDSPIQEYLYRYMTDPTMGMTYPYQPGIVLIDGKSHPVNSYVIIQFKEERYKSKVNKGYLNVTIKKDKKTGAWEIQADKSDVIRCMTCQDSDALKTDLENAIYDCPDLQNLTGEITLKAVVYERRLHSNVSEEITLPHYFELSYLKKGFWDDEYIPLKYEVTL